MRVCLTRRPIRLRYSATILVSRKILPPTRKMRAWTNSSKLSAVSSTRYCLIREDRSSPLEMAYRGNLALITVPCNVTNPESLCFRPRSLPRSMSRSLGSTPQPTTRRHSMSTTTCIYGVAPVISSSGRIKFSM